MQFFLIFVFQETKCVRSQDPKSKLRPYDDASCYKVSVASQFFGCKRDKIKFDFERVPFRLFFSSSC